MRKFIKRFIWLVNNFRFYLTHQGNEILRLQKRVSYLEQRLSALSAKVARK